jgi:phage repressor protein C with HTH and peptisase S24 domain
MIAMTNDERAARDRLAELAREQRCSLKSLSEMIGRNPAYLQQYVMRKSPRKLEEGDRRKLAEFFGVAETELGASPEKSPERAPVGSRSDEFVAVPRLPLDASAGPGAFSAEEISYDTFRFTRRWLRELGLEGANLSAIRVEGDSMEPLLRSGDEVFVDRNKRAGEGVFVVRIGDALHVKQVQASAPGRIKLVSANEAYPPIELSGEDVEMIGRVVWKGGRL